MLAESEGEVKEYSFINRPIAKEHTCEYKCVLPCPGFSPIMLPPAWMHACDFPYGVHYYASRNGMDL